MKVLCVAPDATRLAEVKRAVVAAEWELCPGASDPDGARAQLDAERPHVLVAVGDFDEVVAEARDRFPALRIVADRDLPEVDVVVTSLGQLRGAVGSTPHPSGPVR
jgi:hypothetical protein